MGIVTAILVLTLLIIVHELGHFLAARAMGVGVLEFGLGLPFFVKKPWFAKKIGQTLYTFYPFFVGGFVRMKGQEDTDPRARSYDPDSYSVKRPWQRIVILVAGPLFNLLFAFGLYWGAGMVGVPTLAPVVAQVQPGSAAEAAGLRPGDRIVAIDARPITEWNEISEYIKKHGLAPLTITCLRDGKSLTLEVTPTLKTTQTIFGETVVRPMIGIGPSGESFIRYYSGWEAFLFGAQQTEQAATLILQSLEKLVTGVVSVDQVGGVVGIVDVTAKASEHGIVPLMLFAALLSVNLGILNLLPIPALDGGHIIFNLYEMIVRRPPSEAVFVRLTMMGWALLAGLMVLGLYNDIVRLSGG
ncbi:MAG: RIP metalloprotease RseP [Campylobacterales bacterium]